MNGLAERATMRASRFLEDRVGRRGFLTKSALAASAMTVAPVDFALKPMSALSAICRCQGQDCDCSAACCDGYTEFCCTISGQNSCPPNSVIAGWWKADGSGLCVESGVERPRYYMDCNATAAGECAPGKGATAATNDCSCGCTNGDCNSRRTCCVAFRYGQCHNEIPCLGPIVCRVVSCTEPWNLEPTCTTAVATDNFTRTHDAPCLQSTPDAKDGSLPMAYTGGLWTRAFDRVDNAPQAAFRFGDTVWTALVGNVGIHPDPEAVLFWDGLWTYRDSLSTGVGEFSMRFGDRGMTPLLGDWNGTGAMTPGVFFQGQWHLKNSWESGPADIVFRYGSPGDTPIVGDWNGDGRWTPGVVRGIHWYLRNSNTTGFSDIYFAYGVAAAPKVVGDWNNDGRFTPGVVIGNRWYIRNSNSTGGSDASFVFDVPNPAGSTYLTWKAG